MRIYQLPDSTSVSLINDHNDKIKFSTFRDDGTILMHVGHRFFLFDKDGIFMDEVEFNLYGDDVYPGRMNLLAMSQNNKFFLFEDRKINQYFIYTIVQFGNHDQSEDLFSHLKT